MAKARMYAKNNHPVFNKMDRLINFIRSELKLELSFYKDRIFVKDMETNEKDWEIVNTDGEFVNELPTERYKLARDMEYESKPKVKTILGMATKDMRQEPAENN